LLPQLKIIYCFIVGIYITMTGHPTEKVPLFRFV